MSKPDPIVLAPGGVEPTPITMNEQPPEINWNRLAALPPFQGYVTDKVKDDPVMSNIENSLHLAQAFIGRMKKQSKLAWMLEDYAAWHSDQGNWPNETPMGESR